MSYYQNLLLYLLTIYSLSSAIKGYLECRKNNAFKYSFFYYPLGAWVWGDAFIFGIFWFLVSIFFLFIQKNWNLFLLIVSVFWTVRSFGEISYWIQQQFSTINRNPPKNMFFYSLFKDDSIWFIYQIIWQCIAVVSIICTIYFTFVNFS